MIQGFDYDSSRIFGAWFGGGGEGSGHGNFSMSVVVVDGAVGFFYRA